MERNSLKALIWRLIFIDRIYWTRRILSGLTGFSQPDFLIIGAQRAGTTSVFNALGQHPSVAPSLLKEVHYFDLNPARPPAWYFAHFPQHRPKGVITGEASPYYLFHPDVPQRVADLLPDVKLIALLRDPVDRAYSNYQHAVRLDLERRSFADAVDAEIKRIESGRRTTPDDGVDHRERSYIARGFYAEQLDRWLTYVSPERLLLIVSEDYYRAPRETLDRMTRFLTIPPFPGDANLNQVYNASTYAEPLDLALRQQLAAFFAPHNRRLQATYGVEIGDWS